MANTITSQTLLDGSRNTIVKVTILSDASGEITKGIIFDSSAFVNDTQNNKLMRIEYALENFSGTLYWDATTDVQLMTLVADHPSDENFQYTGGLINNGGSGRTGDILLSTSGLASAPAGTTGYIILYVKKK
jgi:hypothetical protein